mmetsp:Transcript_8056/g.24469  ORF Transcript_8056/g.24469 Transcript_8056/m.24469 type:complete len:201 (+) Transcript_8056:413-1015(+)
MQRHRDAGLLAHRLAGPTTLAAAGAEGPHLSLRQWTVQARNWNLKVASGHHGPQGHQQPRLLRRAAVLASQGSQRCHCSHIDRRPPQGLLPGVDTEAAAASVRRAPAARAAAVLRPGWTWQLGTPIQECQDPRRQIVMGHSSCRSNATALVQAVVSRAGEPARPLLRMAAQARALAMRAAGGPGDPRRRRRPLRWLQHLS